MLKTITEPIMSLMKDNRTVGIMLLACTAISLTLANLPQTTGYVGFWNAEIDWLHHLHLPHSILHLVNDALMALFFFLAGMEIRQEMLEGELSSPSKAALPVAAAVGGMVVPAIVYILFNKGTPYAGGWAIPASTDIAFSLGVASLLGKRVPVALKVFLTALAIIDDLGAIVIIALFYGEPVKAFFLFAAAVLILVLYLLNKKKVRFGIVQVVLGILLWYAIYNSGIHATVAGVVFALLIPRHLLESFQHKLHYPVNFVIIPIFALANTAIIIPESPVAALTSSLSWGIILGLVVGKPVGVFAASYLLVQQKKAELPEGVSWMQLTGAGLLAGIGFTMSIFIAVLAFSQPAVQDIAKVAVLAASLLAIIGSVICLRWASPGKIKPK